MDDRVVVLAAVAAAVAAFSAGGVSEAWLLTICCAAALVVWIARLGSAPTALVAIAVVLLVGLRAHQDLAGLDRPLPQRIEAVAELGSDPEPMLHGTRVDIVADGRRWTATLGREVESTVRRLRSGDRVHLQASVSPLVGAPLGWVRARHLAGRLSVRSISPAPGTRIWFAAANAVHEVLGRGAKSLGEEHRSLYLGLVVGDDRGQSELTRFRFRASGLTHLLAVSGQNVAFLLAVLAPLTTRLTHRWRWVLGVVAVVGFVVVTRAEPSVLRAATMAALGLTASATGRLAPGPRVLALSVLGLLVADPMLVHSVGFQLSVGATAGLVVLVRPLTRWMPGPRWLQMPVSVTLAAQIGATPVMALTFGAVSLLAVPANLLAEPAAGAVMTLGLSEGILAGLVREEVASVLQLPVRAMVWWIDAVATCTARLSAPPVGPVAWFSALAGIAAGVRVWRWRGSEVVGRAVVVAAVPLLVLLRPPSGSPIALGGGASVQQGCDGWELDLGERSLADERASVELLDQLWHLGLARVSVVVVGADRSTGADRGSELAEWLGAVVQPEQRGPPCRLAA